MIKEVTPQIAALYLGQKCDVEWLIDYKSCGIQKGVVWTDMVFEDFMLKWIAQNDVKIIPYLRRLSSMTEEEAREVYKLATGDEWDTSLDHVKSGAPSAIYDWFLSDDYFEENSFSPMALVTDYSAAWLYLLSKGFDLFGLIDARLAKEAQ